MLLNRIIFEDQGTFFPPRVLQYLKSVMEEKIISIRNVLGTACHHETGIINKTTIFTIVYETVILMVHLWYTYIRVEEYTII